MLSAVPQEALETEIEAMLAEGLLRVRESDGRVTLASLPLKQLPEPAGRISRRAADVRLGV